MDRSGETDKIRILGSGKTVESRVFGELDELDGGGKDILFTSATSSGRIWSRRQFSYSTMPWSTRRRVHTGLKLISV